jgi:hypothetical protein
MRLILKIAAGVTLGMVLFMGLRAFPAWYADSQEQKAFITLQLLTPEKVIRQCGPPQDDRSDKNDPLRMREFIYTKTSDGQTYLSPWHIHFNGKYLFDVADEWNTATTNSQKLRRFNCLAH